MIHEWFLQQESYLRCWFACQVKRISRMTFGIGHNELKLTIFIDDS